MSAIIPRGDRVIAKRVVGPDQVGSVVIPDVARQKTQECVVLYQGAGPEVADLPAGTHVLVANYGGTVIEHDGRELVVLRDTDVIAILRD